MNKERASTSQTNQSVDNEADNQMFGRRSSNGRNRSQGRQPQGQVRYLSKRDFKELFRFEENDRDKRELKKEFKAIDKKFKSKIQFKDFIGKFPPNMASLLRLVFCRFLSQFKRCLR